MKYDVIRMVRHDAWRELNSLIEDGSIKVEEAAKEVIETKKAMFIREFALYVESAPIDMLVDSLIELEAYGYIGLYFWLINTQMPIDKELKEKAHKCADSFLMMIIARDIAEDIVPKIKVNFSDDEFNCFMGQLFQLIHKLLQNPETKLSTQNVAPNMPDESQCYQAGDNALSITFMDGENPRDGGFSRRRVSPLNKDDYKQ